MHVYKVGILEKLHKFKKLTKLVLNLQSLSDSAKAEQALVSFREKHTLWTTNYTKNDLKFDF